MKKITRYILPVAVVGSLFMTSCDKGFEEMNTDPNKPVKSDPNYLLTAAQKRAMDNIWDQWNNGRFGMMYAQYWSATVYSDESRYQIRESVNTTFWNDFYAGVLKDLNEIIKINESNPALKNVNQVAIAEIMKVWGFHMLTDVYGDIPYTEAFGGLSKPTAAYDRSEAIYTDLLAKLDASIAALDASKLSFTTGDVIYGGNVAKWKKFANSLKLRIAMRMADVKPAEAKKAVEEAVASGVFTSNADNALFKYLAGAPNNNPIEEAFKTRIDFSTSKTLVDYIKPLKDPRLFVFSYPASNAKVIDGDAFSVYFGEAYGLSQGNSEVYKDGDVSLPYAKVDPANPSAKGAFKAEQPGIYMDYAEVEFLLAEAVERGMNVGGTAEEHYNKGIVASMNYWGIVDETVISTYLAKVPYSSGSWKNVIGTQKWIAMFGQGIEAWLERIRLDFKKPSGADLFVAPADGSLDINVTMVPTRMTYPIDQQTLNKENYLNAVSKIAGGKDIKSAKQWWDKF